MASIATTPQSQTSGLSKRLRGVNLQTYGLIGAVILIWLFFAILTHGTFVSARNVSNLFRQLTATAIMSCGMVLVIVTGGIDLSVGTVMTFSAVMTAQVMIIWQQPILVGIAAGLAVMVTALAAWSVLSADNARLAYALQGLDAAWLRRRRRGGAVRKGAGGAAAGRRPGYASPREATVTSARAALAALLLLPTAAAGAARFAVVAGNNQGSAGRQQSCYRLKPVARHRRWPAVAVGHSVGDDPAARRAVSDEMIREIEFPAVTGLARQTFLKFTLRRPIDFAIVSVAALITIADGVCTDARIALGAVAPGACRAVAAEEFLKGRPIDADTAVQAGELALREAKPLSRNAYKIEIARTLVKRSILGL